MTSEHAEQVALVDWCAWQANRDPRFGLLFAIPNGGARDRITAAKLKREGVKPGVADLMLPVAAAGYHGLFIEMKRQDGGRVAREQLQWQRWLTEQGFLSVVCNGFDEARIVLSFYLGS